MILQKQNSSGQTDDVNLAFVRTLFCSIDSKDEKYVEKFQPQVL